MIILGIETSCDETGAAIITASKKQQPTRLLSNVLASSLTKHAETGGIIPETAAREQLSYILPVLKQTLKKVSLSLENIDAIAVTVGPGLIGSLLVGVETAKTLSFVFKKPLIPINHLIGHIYANWIDMRRVDRSQSTVSVIPFPALCLIVSGGHTDLVLLEDHGKIKWLGGTRDDAAGEAFDKIGRLLGLPYPGGPAIENASQKGNPKAYAFPRPMIDSDNFDFSFSGLKTAVLRTIQTTKQPTSPTGRLNNKTISNISASFQQAVVDVLVTKTIKAAIKYKVKSILLGGGVAANQHLRNSLELNAKRYTLNARIFAPQKSLCTDNAAMIATAAFFNYKPLPWHKIIADPELYFS